MILIYGLKWKLLHKRFMELAVFQHQQKLKNKLQNYRKWIWKYPVCVAKTQYSFSTDPTLRGAPSDHVITIREATPEQTLL